MLNSAGIMDIQAILPTLQIIFLSNKKQHRAFMNAITYSTQIRQKDTEKCKLLSIIKCITVIIFGLRFAFFTHISGK